jgi:hypothetical protein
VIVAHKVASRNSHWYREFRQETKLREAVMRSIELQPIEVEVTLEEILEDLLYPEQP